MSSILRRLKKLVGIRYSNADHDEMTLLDMKRSGRFSEIEKGEGIISFKYNGSLPAFARVSPHSDLSVSSQVFVQQEYRTVVDFLKVNFPLLTSPRIIDAGANVGYSSLFFFSEFPDARIACVEPDNSNLAMMERNLASFIKKGQLRIFPGGLLSEGGRSIVTVNDFRDGKDWSVSITEVEGESGLKSVSVTDILKEMKWDRVDIIKMDIEGSERFVFDNDSRLEFLDLVTCMAIEIHDEFGCRAHIYEKLRDHGFLILNYGETTFGISSRALRSQ